MSHTPGPWRWGCWVLRPDKPKIYISGQQGYPNYEFKEKAEPYSMDELVLSTAEYGSVMDLDETKKHSIIESVSCGDGGESDILIEDDDANLIASAPEMLEELKEFLKLDIDWDGFERIEKLVAKVEGRKP